ncbi:phage tail sheath family protein [Thermomonospora amylolytica]|uniref:phage tail sheath family protein n=1 Tax=Thermomonospora amylolytica TaxID=1411117 RepID=UPI000E6CEF42|nr:phage tail sheath C-terminal domain-containing protein [Thermomonospora amylolytica]
MTVSHPGVYVQEVSGGTRPIQAAGTSTAAFLGVAERGPIGSVRKIFNFTEFQSVYGGFLKNHYLAHAVFQFFNNGGTQCYVVRVSRDPKAAQVPPRAADVTVQDRAPEPQNALTFSASSEGAWGNSLEVAVSATGSTDPDNTFDLDVFRSAQGQERPRLLESFTGLSMNPKSPSYVEDVVNSRSAYLRVKANRASTNHIAGFLEGTPMPGTGALIGPTQRKLQISLHGDGFQEIDLTDALPTGEVSDPEAIRGALETVIRATRPLRASTPEQAYTEATVTLAGEGDRRLRITSGQAQVDSTVEVLEADDPAENAAGPLGLGRGARGVHGSSAMRPRQTPPDRTYMVGDAVVKAPVSAAHRGEDGSTPTDQDYIAAFGLLDTILDFSLLAVPGIGSEAVADAGMNYCRKRPLSDCFFIADMAVHDNSLQEAERWRDTIKTPNSYGAVYFPWLLMLDPNGGPEPIPVPPSGFVAGMYAQTDARRGVWKSPAGVQANLAGAVGLTAELTDRQQGGLNTHPKSVCAIRRFPGSGIVLWGARTLSADPEYRYIAVRRLAIFLKVSIFNGVQWAVFEPNDEPLWSQLRINLNAFMMTLFRQGAFQGATPDQAFFVKVDAETTTQADIDNGVVNILVGFAPLKPAEFVVVRISQKAGQAG